MFDTHAMTELQLTAENYCGDNTNAVWKMLSKKHKAGVFNYERALDYVDQYMIVPAAKDYTYSHCSMTQSWSQLYPKSLRMKVAENIVDSMLAEFRIGNYWS